MEKIKEQHIKLVIFDQIFSLLATGTAFTSLVLNLSKRAQVICYNQLAENPFVAGTVPVFRCTEQSEL